jgi:hypothetical protein
VGHQGAAQLRLVESLRARLGPWRRQSDAWRLWDRWISEIVPDCWAISKIGIGSTLGLIGLVSLPRAFVFGPVGDDPHPIPWIRVLLSCAIGDRLYPDPQWTQLAGTWRSLYPLTGVPPRVVALLGELQATLPEFVSVLLGHRPEVLRNPGLERATLLRRYADWRADPDRMAHAPPTLAFAVLGQARASGLLSPERESRLLHRLIVSWAMKSTLETARTFVRSGAEMFGQPAIWSEPAADPAQIGEVSCQQIATREMSARAAR